MRNNFAEMQLTSVDWVYKKAERQTRKPVESNETADRVPERNVGVWAGWSTPNQWFGQTGITHCCTGNAPRGLYYVWEHMLDHEDGELRINLLMNRASRWADVYSFIPYEGRVDLKVKEAFKSVLLRAPEWIETNSPQVVCQVNGAARSLNWEGRYVNVGATRPGDKLVITFPISEKTVREKIGPQTYTLVVKGNTVVSIDPPGKDVPLYQDRAKYRKAEVQWRKVWRFVSEEQIRW